MGGVEEQHLVATFNLDWLLAKFHIPNVVKMDVEGAELEVLRNQHRMLTEVRPVIICEVGSQTADELTRVLTSASYRLFDGEKSLDKTANRQSRELEHDRNIRGKSIRCFEIC